MLFCTPFLVHQPEITLDALIDAISVAREEQEQQRLMAMKDKLWAYVETEAGRPIPEPPVVLGHLQGLDPEQKKALMSGSLFRTPA